MKHVAIHDGFVEVSNNTVAILADTAELAEDIDVDRAQEALRVAQERVESDENAGAEAELRRAHARLAAAGGLGKR